MRSLAAVCVLALLGGAATPARAETPCPPATGIGGGPAAIPGEVRLAWIDAHLEHTARRARRWTWGWGIGIGVATLANLAPLPFVAPEDRIDWYTGAATTVVGIVPLLIAPLDVIEDSRALNAAIDQAIRGATPTPGAAVRQDQVCALVADAESRLIRSANNQADGQRWWLHVGNVALNFGVGLFLGLGYHHWGAGALNAVGGSIIGEAIILSQPTGTIDDLRRYRAGELDEEHTTGSRNPAAGRPPWAIGYGLRF